MRGFEYIGNIRNRITKEKWGMYSRKGVYYMYTIDEDYKPIEKVKTFKTKSEIKQYLYENKPLTAFLTIFI